STWRRARRSSAAVGCVPAVCMLCLRAEADPDTCGDKWQKQGICAHYFATLLSRKDNDRLGILGFLPRDIQHAVRRAAQQHCCVCGQSGATIMCCKEDCGRWFHLPCAKEGGCVTQYIPDYSSYCPEHSPQQDAQVTPEPGTECPICMEPVEDRKTFRTMVCPACKKAWFHRDCIQVGAIPSAPGHSRCSAAPQPCSYRLSLHCRDRPWLSAEGDRRAQLDNPVLWILCPQHHDPVSFPRPWELLLCSSCAAEGTHRRCAGLRNSTPSWECDSCAGVGTGMRQSTRVALGWGCAHAGLSKACLLLEGWERCIGLACLEPGAP
uniref:PHD-type domain-containing protein n=1 Tax=Malurus cyaneus samueli TaxID=2593467 RepID=A0A8C5UHY7_9PASS